MPIFFSRFMAFSLGKIFELEAGLLAGVILVGTCPGGTSSNVITYMSKGNVALSVGMTSVNTLGFVVNKFAKKRATKVIDILPVVSVIAICLIVSTVVSHNAEKILTTGAIVFVVVILHNLLGYACGFGLGKVLKMDMPKTKALTVEIGMQNSGLATSLANTAFPSLAMATVFGAIFSVWHNISGAILANILRNRE